MKRSPAQRISDWLLVLLILLLCLDILATLLAPSMAHFRFAAPTEMQLSSLMSTFAYDFDDGVGNLLNITLGTVWQKPESAVLALFLLVCGICAALILVQGIRILATVSDGSPFSPENPISLKRAAAGCFCIAAAALGRTVFSILWKGTAESLLSYTALFIPLFTMAGLLCLVMAGLFHRAAEMKAENDLTI